MSKHHDKIYLNSLFSVYIPGVIRKFLNVCKKKSPVFFDGLILTPRKVWWNSRNALGSKDFRVESMA